MVTAEVQAPYTKHCARTGLKTADNSKFRMRQRLVEAAEHLIAACHRPDDGGNTHLRNVGQFLQDNTAQHSRKLSS
jgi:hypothetical protein